MRDGLKRLKYTLLPSLSNQLPDAVPPRYKALCHSTDDTPELIAQIASARAICTGRYHALCFALQQNTPFIAVPSNSGKIEALLMDVGLPRNIYLLYKRDHASLHNGLERAIDRHPTVEATIKAFNDSARQKIDDMFDSITSNPQG
jgi:polysaccharide pyruvyl transferase WcaK-like protein